MWASLTRALQTTLTVLACMIAGTAGLATASIAQGAHRAVADVEQHSSRLSSSFCNEHAVRVAVSGTSLGLKMRKLEGFGPRNIHWGIDSLICGDPTQTGQLDMVALFGCCTAGAPTPLAILRSEHHRWHLTFSSWKPLIWRLLYAEGR